MDDRSDVEMNDNKGGSDDGMGGDDEYYDGKYEDPFTEDLSSKSNDNDSKPKDYGNDVPFDDIEDKNKQQEDVLIVKREHSGAKLETEMDLTETPQDKNRLSRRSSSTSNNRSTRSSRASNGNGNAKTEKENAADLQKAKAEDLANAPTPPGPPSDGEW